MTSRPTGTKSGPTDAWREEARALRQFIRDDLARRQELAERLGDDVSMVRIPPAAADEAQLRARYAAALERERRQNRGG